MRKKILCISILIGTFISGTLFAGCDGNSVKAEANDTTHSLETEVEDMRILSNIKILCLKFLRMRFYA